MAKTFLLLLFTVACFWVQAQTMITGKIVDSKSQTPVPFATVRLSTEKGIFGAISNADGDFQIPLKYKEITDTVRVTCIGYSTKTMLLADLSTETVNIILLRESASELSEVVIEGKRLRKLSAKKIVESAIQNIGKNYPVEPSSYIAYYRDYQVRESQYINLNEAIVEVYDEGFDSNDHSSTRVGLYEYIKNQTFERDTTTEVPYDNSTRGKFVPGARLSPFGGNELSVLRIHDAIRNHESFSFSFVDVLDSNFVSNHTFKLLPTVYLNQIPLYHISFTSRSIVSAGHSVKGDIYIEQGTFAIHKLEYENYRKVEKNLELLYSIQIEYALHQSLMHLNYISFNDLFLLKNPMDFETVDIVLNRPANAFIVLFNSLPQATSALNAENYHFTYQNNPLAVDRVVLSSTNPSEVVVYLKPNDLPRGATNSEVAERLGAKVSGVLDLDGREVNKPTYIQINQFRELFVQERSFVPRSSVDSLFVDKEKPLSQSAKVPGIDIDVAGFWMNTPLKSNK